MKNGCGAIPLPWSWQNLGPVCRAGLAHPRPAHHLWIAAPVAEAQDRASVPFEFNPLASDRRLSYCSGMVEDRNLPDGTAGSNVSAGAAATVVPSGLTCDADSMRPVPLAEIRTALAGAMIETCYQPVVRLADRAVIGFEALVRLNHPARGMVHPRCIRPADRRCRPGRPTDRTGDHLCLC